MYTACSPRRSNSAIVYNRESSALFLLLRGEIVNVCSRQERLKMHFLILVQAPKPNALVPFPKASSLFNVMLHHPTWQILTRNLQL